VIPQRDGREYVVPRPAVEQQRDHVAARLREAHGPPDHVQRVCITGPVYVRARVEQRQDGLDRCAARREVQWQCIVACVARVRVCT
jgi:hypothetical protein